MESRSRPLRLCDSFRTRVALSPLRMKIIIDLSELLETAVKTFADDGPDYRPDDGSGDEFGKPMDSDRNAETHIERVQDGRVANKFVSGV